jgi:hypothetical protein
MHSFRNKPSKGSSCAYIERIEIGACAIKVDLSVNVAVDINYIGIFFSICDLPDAVPQIYPFTAVGCDDSESPTGFGNTPRAKLATGKFANQERCCL